MLEYATVTKSEYGNYKNQAIVSDSVNSIFPFFHNTWLVVIISELQFTTNSKATFYDSKKQRPYE